MSRSPWNHAMCERCWFDGPWGVLEDGTYRQPTRVLNSEPMACCYCGGLTIMGIFVRGDPASMDQKCFGEHENLSWSRVAARSHGE